MALTRTKKIIFSIALILILLLICFTLLDLVMSILYPITRIYEYSPYTDYIIKPSQQLTFASKEFTTEVTTNSYGLRGKELDLTREYRIMLLGDSFTFGHGVSDEEAYAALLQDKLNTLPEKPLVINAGHNGYDTRRELNYLKYYGYKLNPDLIIVDFMFNDAYSNSGEYWFSTVPTGFARHIPFQSVATLIEYLKQPKVLLYKLGFKMKGNVRNVDHFDCLRENKCEKGWNATFGYLSQLNEYTKENNMQLAIVNIPSQEFFDSEKNSTFNPKLVSEKLKAFAENNNIQFIDLSNAGFEKADYFPQDGHWKVSGNIKAADYVFEKLSVKP